MVALGRCPGCTDRDHSKHIFWISEPPPGLLGGLACGCSGECVNLPKVKRRWEQAIEDFFDRELGQA
jgi:hypothetical protein